MMNTTNTSRSMIRSVALVAGLALSLVVSVPAMAGPTPAGGTRPAGATASAPARPNPTVVPVKGSERPATGKVSIELMVVHATNSSTTVDPALRSVVDNFKFTRFSGFELLSRHPAQLAVGQEMTIQVAGNRRVKLELLDRDNTEAKVRVRMMNDQGVMVDTTVSIHRDRSFIIAGPNYKDGKLILPVSVAY